MASRLAFARDLLEEQRAATARAEADARAAGYDQALVREWASDAVVGTHTHTQTADDQLFPGGTAFLCDAGMCGPMESCLGREIAPIIERFLTGRPVLFPVARGPVKLHGAIVEIDERSGRALRIERVAHLFESARE
jgi:calcineurin-like phosphoesterase